MAETPYPDGALSRPPAPRLNDCEGPLNARQFPIALLTRRACLGSRVLMRRAGRSTLVLSGTSAPLQPFSVNVAMRSTSAEKSVRV